MFSRSWKAAPRLNSLSKRNEFIVQGVLSEKIFDFVKPANVSLWNERQLFRAAEVKANWRATKRVHEPSAAHFMANMVLSVDLSVFPEIRSAIRAATWSRAAGSERDCADLVILSRTSMVS